MNTPRSPLAATRPWFRLFLTLGLAAGSGLVAQPAGEGAKSHVLFMGADIDVQLGKDLLRVKNVAGDSFVVAKDQRPVEIPMNRGTVPMKVTPTLKLTNKTATVTALQVERAYTPQNDPNRKWAAAQAGSAAQASVGMSAGKMANAMMGAQQSSIRGAALGGPSGALAGGDASAQISAYHSASAAAGSDINSAGYSAGQLQAELDQQLFDAVEVTCEVSAPRALTDPYLVVIAHYREKDQAGATKSWIFAKALERLDENPLKVRVVQGGFPPGFELVRQEFHLYGGGRELGTNVAEKNVFLTRDEAHEYIVIDHLTSHKGATLAPSVALGVATKDFYPHFGQEQLQQAIFVKVDPAGRPAGAFRDEKCTQPTDDAHLAKLVGETRFKPALKAGKPVDGVAKLKIAELAI